MLEFHLVKRQDVQLGEERICKASTLFSGEDLSSKRRPPSYVCHVWTVFSRILNLGLTHQYGRVSQESLKEVLNVAVIIAVTIPRITHSLVKPLKAVIDCFFSHFIARKSGCAGRVVELIAGSSSRLGRCRD